MMQQFNLFDEEQIIQAGYDQMWQQGYSDLYNGIIDSDPVPDDTSLRWGVSIIARIELADAALFLNVIEQLRGFTGEQQTLYRAENLHTTIRSCEFFRSTIAEDDLAIHPYWTVTLS